MRKRGDISPPALTNPPRRPSTAKAERGFSLVELMVVISIIGLLSTIVALNVLKKGGTAKIKKVEADVKQVDDAITLFHNDTGRFPTALDELIESSVPKWDGPYIRGGMKALKDPWGNEYYFSFTGAGDPPYEIGSYGADGSPGGEGENGDVFPHRDDR